MTWEMFGRWVFAAVINIREYTCGIRSSVHTRSLTRAHSHAHVQWTNPTGSTVKGSGKVPMLVCDGQRVVRTNKNAFRRLQVRFCTGADTNAYANVSGRTQLHYAAASGRTRLHMQNRPADIIAYAIMSSG